MKHAILVLSLVLLAGCVNFAEDRNAPPVAHYVLRDAGQAARPAAAVDPRTLLVLDTTTSSFYDVDSMVFSRSPGTRSYYQYARWTERPGKRFADLLRARLESQGNFAAVAAAGGYVRGDLLLDTELVEFYHDASSDPGQVHILLRAELVDLRKRALLGRILLEQRVDATSYDATGAAAAFDVAAGRALDELMQWLAKVKN